MLRACDKTEPNPACYRYDHCHWHDYWSHSSRHINFPLLHLSPLLSLFALEYAALGEFAVSFSVSAIIRIQCRVVMGTRLQDASKKISIPSSFEGSSFWLPQYHLMTASPVTLASNNNQRKRDLCLNESPSTILKETFSFWSHPQTSFYLEKRLLIGDSRSNRRNESRARETLVSSRKQKLRSSSAWIESGNFRNYLS